MHKLFILLSIASFLIAVETTAIVTKITDGDTLHVTINSKEEKVRILYIDTPEKYCISKKG